MEVVATLVEEQQRPRERGGGSGGGDEGPLFPARFGDEKALQLTKGS